MVAETCGSNIVVTQKLIETIICLKSVMPCFAAARVQQGYGLGNLFCVVAQNRFSFGQNGCQNPRKTSVAKWCPVYFGCLEWIKHQTSGHQSSKSGRFIFITSGQTESMQVKDILKKRTKEETQETLPRI